MGALSRDHVGPTVAHVLLPGHLEPAQVILIYLELEPDVLA